MTILTQVTNQKLITNLDRFDAPSRSLSWGGESLGPALCLLQQCVTVWPSGSGWHDSTGHRAFSTGLGTGHQAFSTGLA